MANTTLPRPPKDVVEMLRRWMKATQDYADAHEHASFKAKERHLWIGSASVVLSALATSSTVVTVQQAFGLPDSPAVLAFLSFLAGTLAALVTFYNYSALSVEHRIAAQEYESITRHLDVHCTSVATMNAKQWRGVLQGYAQTLEDIGKRADVPRMQLKKRTEVVHWKGVTSGGTRTEVRVTDAPSRSANGWLLELNEVWQEHGDA